MTETQDAGAWHLDKRIPIALIFTLIVQTAVAVWWLADLSSRVDSATAVNARQDAQITAAEAALNSQEVNAATTAAQLVAVRESLGELKEGQAELTRLLRELSRGTQP
jgi:hypothetical protein